MVNINILELTKQIKEEGYDGEYVEAKLCQDIILLLISKSVHMTNVTIKGGVVMRSLSNNIRRATLDIDIDFIKYPLTDDGIIEFIKSLNGIMGIKIDVVGKFEELNHQDYRGKRVYVTLKDEFKNKLNSKIDIGVHKYFSLPQEEYYYDISFDSKGATLFINSKEQILTEKLKSILKFGSLSTRYKDVYDIYYLSSIVDKEKLLKAFQVLIYNDKKMKENDVNSIIKRIENTFNNSSYLNKLETSEKNWLGISNEKVLVGIISFLKELNHTN